MKCLAVGIVSATLSVAVVASTSIRAQEPQVPLIRSISSFGDIQFATRSDRLHDTRGDASFLSFVWDMAVRNDTLFCALTNGISLYKLKAHECPQLLEQLPYFGTLTSINVFGSTIVACDRDRGIVTFAMDHRSHGRSPHFKGIEGGARSITMLGNAALVLTPVGLNVFDMSNPPSIKDVATISLGNAYRSFGKIAARDQLAYIASGAFYVIDCTNATEPDLLSQTQLIQHAVDVALVANYAVVAERAPSVPPWESRVTLLDISDPRAPVIKWSIRFSGREIESLIATDSAVFVSLREEGISVLDIRNILAPSVLYHQRVKGARHVVGDDSLLFLATGYDDVGIIDPLSPEEPCDTKLNGFGARSCNCQLKPRDILAYSITDWSDSLAFDYSIPIPLRSYGVYCSDDVLVAADNKGEAAFARIRNGSLEPKGRLVLPEPIEDAVITDRVALFCCGGGGVVGVDLKDLSAPRILWTLPLAGGAHAIDVNDRWAVVAAWMGGIVVLDIGNPRLPIIAARAQAQDMTTDVAFGGDHVFSAERYAGLFAYHFQSNSGLHIIDQYPAAGEPAWCIYVTAERDMVIAADDMTVQEFSVKRDGQLDLEQQFTLSFPMGGLAFDGRVLAVAKYYEGVELLDLSSRHSPQVLLDYDTPGIAMRVARSEDYIYVADVMSLLRFDIPDIGVDFSHETTQQSRSQDIEVSEVYPCPANSEFGLTVTLTEHRSVALSVYNILGQLVVRGPDQLYGPGTMRISVNTEGLTGIPLASGVYLVKLVIGDKAFVRKSVLLK